MKTIIEELKINKKLENEQYVELLAFVGFPKITTNYQIITPLAIEKYLEYVLKDKYINQQVLFCSRKYLDANYNSKYRDYSFFEICYYFTNGPKKLFRNTERIQSNIHLAGWKETDINKFKCTPPIHILNSIKDAKDKFDELKIVTVHIEEIILLDPLVVGINKNNSDRYLIDWWDKDIDISQINIK